MTKNTIVRVDLKGGLIGKMLVDPIKAMNSRIREMNDVGWRSTFVLPYTEHNYVVIFAQALVLICTLGLWTWGGGYIVMFERND